MSLSPDSPGRQGDIRDLELDLVEGRLGEGEPAVRSIAALSSEESSFAFGRAEHIGFLVVGVLGLFLLSCKSIARQPWWRSKDKLRDLLENAATNIGEAEFTKTLSSWHMSVTSSETICGDFESRLRMKAPRLRRGTHTWRNCCADPTSAA